MGARKGSPLYVAKKLTNPYGAVLGNPSIMGGHGFGILLITICLLVVSQLWHVMFDICCCLSGVLSPTVGCIFVAVGVATSKVGQTDTETRYVLYFAIVTCCVWYLLLSLRCPFPESKTRICHYYTCVLLSFLTLYLHRLFLLTYIYLYLSSVSTCASVRFLVLPALIIPLCAPTEISLCKFLTITRPLPTSSKVSHKPRDSISQTTTIFNRSRQDEVHCDFCKHRLGVGGMGGAL